MPQGSHTRCGQREKILLRIVTGDLLARMIYNKAIGWTSNYQASASSPVPVELESVAKRNHEHDVV